MEAIGFTKPLKNGEYGSACKEARSVALSAAAIGTEVDFIRLPAGTLLFGIEARNDALAASTTMQFGVRYPDGGGTDDDDLLLAAASTATAGSRSSPGHPIMFDVDVIITGTVAGAAATGTVTVIVDYVFEGTM